MTWTVDEVLSWRTCYPDERIRELCAGVERVTVPWVASLDIPAQDRVCFLLRPEVMTQWLDYIRFAAGVGAALGVEPIHVVDMTYGGERPDGVSHETWALLRLSAYAHRCGALPFEEQLPLLTEILCG